MERLYSPSCLAGLSFSISTYTNCVRREKCLCLFTTFFLFSDCADDVTFSLVVLSRQFCFNVILPYYAPVSYSAVSILLSPELLM